MPWERLTYGTVCEGRAPIGSLTKLRVPAQLDPKPNSLGALNTTDPDERAIASIGHNVLLEHCSPLVPTEFILIVNLKQQRQLAVCLEHPERGVCARKGSTYHRAVVKE